MEGRTSNGTGIEDWQEINWKITNRQVFKIQRRIFKSTQQAQKDGNWKKVVNLMKLLINSKSALLLAIQRVTQINKGKGTAGVDGIITLTHRQRTNLVKKWDWSKAKPAKRVYIPKRNGKKRPLGIPTINDRIGQAILKMAYEPVFEVNFEPGSYGFRPGRSCHDAIQEIFINLRKGSSHRWVLDADIKAAFDNISHEFLMEKIKGFPKREVVRKWLKAGYMEETKFHETKTGTPQGGIISPLLANIALDGIQEWISKPQETIIYKTRSRGKIRDSKKEVKKYRFVRYADDFVITSQTKENLEEVIPTLKTWLAKRGLKLNEEKTQIRDIREEGFSFLGFEIRQHKSKTLILGSNRFKRKAHKMRINAKPNAKRIPSPNAKTKEEETFSCFIKPGKEETKEFLAKIREYLKNEGRMLSFDKVIQKLNSKLRGWLNYYRFVCSKKTFNKIRKEVLDAIHKFLKRRHPRKSWKWIKRNYYTTVDRDKHNPYAYTEGRRKKMEILINAAKDVPIIRYEKIKGSNSPFDPTLAKYWEKRQTKWGKTRFAKGSKYERIYTRQKGICPICGEPICMDEAFEVHHIIPVRDGGNNDSKNLAILHKHCHKAKHKHLHRRVD
ncbi:group II intron reverse transcriptase/maturase [Moorena producens JHB]|uniref:Group II intron reverse transcriptase/maturase n=1 Tax=Moorena producens (strain JHB) TaxID=1454205 RepID=A0A1D9FYF8_MOOP1|nr:group II intron reverse transcriptase/maturase [Moorena producens]AOY80408.1 group II intron reverse transcriptase/maturase [Moorena producens JHB]